MFHFCWGWWQKHLAVRVIRESCSVAQSCPTVCDTMDCSTPGLPVHHQLLELTQTHVCRVGDAIQPSHPLSSSSLPAFNLSQHQGLFEWVSSLHQVARVLEFQIQHQKKKAMTKLDSVLKSRDITLLTKVHLIKPGIFPVVMYVFMDHKESWVLKNWCFWTVVLEKTLESSLDCKEIQPPS